ncbi:CRISPR-associated endonuclease Cas2 [Acidaminococcus massiliensis]|jgi:CRISPR-associated protein Cas2|uniref:CRISPR-associated endonuclease Cas2 n=1 Tax=Acidaminococcus massiliensis TaxID=1852375 RepID=UPI00094E8463|nr:CRISPR-associated endonuclease Cas2 [Acidaminococcus massiliensis]
MIILSYDIADDRLRNHFAKYITKFGHRIQYSVYQIDNSSRVLDNIISYIQGHFEKKFGQSDSVYIFKLSNTCEVVRMGYAKNEEKDLVVF